MSSDWLSRITDSDYTTVEDILKLKKGEKIVFVCIDRNISDILEQNNPLDPLEHNYFMEYTHVQGLNGYACIYTNCEGVDDDRGRPFTFDIGVNIGLIDYSTGETRRNICFIPFDRSSHRTRELPNYMYVGWRGPLVRWDSVIAKTFAFNL
jgi:hypothetical protein